MAYLIDLEQNPEKMLLESNRILKAYISIARVSEVSFHFGPNFTQCEIKMMNSKRTEDAQMTVAKK